MAPAYNKFKVGVFELYVLLAINARAEDGIIAPQIKEILRTKARTLINDGPLYQTLARLNRKGLVQKKSLNGRRHRISMCSDSNLGRKPESMYQITTTGSNLAKSCLSTLRSVADDYQTI
jgi:hypothetical protein